MTDTDEAAVVLDALPAKAAPESDEEAAIARQVVTVSDPKGAQAESIRALRTHIVAQHVQEGRRALAICAASPGVGCTFVAANLAVALAQIGLKTLLVDANLRSPGVDKLLMTPRSSSGLQQYLASAAEAPADYIVTGIVPNLSVLYAGGAAPNPQELLALDRFKSLMDLCMRDYDVTIVDTPAANTCADARRISNVLGYSLIVARRDKSFVDDVKTLTGQLKVDRARVVGTVLNEG